MQIEKIKREVIRLLKQNNDPNSYEKVKYIVKHKEFFKNIYMFWPNALLINSLFIINDDDSSIEIDNQFRLFKHNRFRISNFDDGLMVFYFLKNNYNNPELSVLETNMIGFCNEFFGNIIPYRKKNPSCIYIDLLGMITPFLCEYGKNKKSRETIEWSISQFDSFMNYGFDKSTKLPYHAYSIDNKEKFGIVGWGRGIGWILIGLSECVVSLGKESLDTRMLLDMYNDITFNAFKYIRNDGGFSWYLSEAKESHLDTSATSMILYSALNLKYYGFDIGNIDNYIQPMIDCLKENTIDGKVINCSSECGGLGIYPQVYDSYSWSVGPTCSSYYLHNYIISQKKILERNNKHNDNL